MTNTERTTTNGPWTVGPIDGDGGIPVWSDSAQFVLARETRADLELLRDALIEHLAPERPGGQTYNAIFNLSTRSGATGWANFHVRTAGPTPTPDEVNEMSKAAAKHFGASLAILVNLIPLAGA